MDVNGTDSRNNVSLAAALGSQNKTVQESAAAAFASLLVQGNSQMNATMQLGGERLMSNSDSDNVEGDGNLDNYSRRDDIAARDDRNDSGSRADDNRPERQDDRADRPDNRNDSQNDGRRDDQRASGDDDARPRDDQRSDNGSQNEDHADDGADDRPQQASNQQDDGSEQGQSNPNTETSEDGSALQQASNQSAGNVVSAAASEFGQTAAAMASGQINHADTNGQQNASKNPAQAAAQMVDGKVVGGENANQQSGQAMAQNQGKGQAQAQAKGPMETAVQQSTNQSGEAKEAMSQQAADLGQKLNNDKPMAVKVNVKTAGTVADTQSNLSQSMVAELGEEAVVKKGPNKNQSAEVAAKAAANQARQATAQAEQQVNANAAAQTNTQNTQTQAAQAGAAQAKGAGQVNAAQTATSTQALSQGGESANAGPANSTQQTQQTEQAKAAQAPRPAQTFKPTTVVDQVSVQITKALHMGADKISIQLRPDSLGKIEVQLATQKDGPTLVTIIADRADTLDLLKNDSRELQKALQQAGLDTDAGSMEFSLREQNKETAEEGKKGSQNAQAGEEDELDIEEQLGLIRPDAGSVLNYRPVGLGGRGVDVNV